MCSKQIETRQERSQMTILMYAFTVQVVFTDALGCWLMPFESVLPRKAITIRGDP